MRSFPVDLFGEVVNTSTDIEAWLRAVPKIDPSSPRAARYVRDWSVPDKIRRAKLAGDFDSVIARPPPPPPAILCRLQWP